MSTAQSTQEKLTAPMESPAAAAAATSVSTAASPADAITAPAPEVAADNKLGVALTAEEQAALQAAPSVEEMYGDLHLQQVRVQASDRYSMQPIGVIHTPYGEKFGVPRQPGIVPSSHSRICLFAPFGDSQAVEGLLSFSHLHVIFLFDQISPDEKFRRMIRPPRLGGNKRVGVFASRSPFRPNRIGLSVVKIEGVEVVNKLVTILVSGADMVDGTPVLDIKPYVPFVDAIYDAVGGFALQPPEKKTVVYSKAALADLKAAQERGAQLNLQLLDEVMAQDPRPAYKSAEQDDKVYFVVLAQHRVSFMARGEQLVVLALEPLPQ